MARTRIYGKLAKYLNTPEAIARFCHYYGVPDDVHLEYRYWKDTLTGEPGDLILPMVAIIEGGVRFPLNPLLTNFLDYFNLSPTQINPNIFRIIMGVVKLNCRLGLDLTVHDIIATYSLRTSGHEAYSLRLWDVENTLVNSLPDTNKNMTDDFLLVRGAWHHPNQRCPTVEGKPVDDRRKLKKHLTNFAALKIVYDSEVCIDDYGNPCSAFLLLRYVSSARTFLLCRKVKDIVAAQSKLENQAPPAHNIQHPLGHVTQSMAGINLWNLLPPRAPAAASVPAPTGGPWGRKRKNSSQGETSRAEDLVLEQVPIVPSQEPGASKAAAQVWAPAYEVFGDPVMADAFVMAGGEAGPNVARALSEVVHLPVDMAGWGKFTNQGVTDSLCRGLMMVQAAQLQHSLRNATKYLTSKKEVKEYKEMAKGGGEDKTLEGEMADRERTAFDRELDEAQATMTNQLPGMYNEAFQEGWKTLYAWLKSEDIPELPPRENLPYSNAPIGVTEEEVSTPQPHPT
uniref:Uncharacterized protein n=1 Tax=Fagus sylvatica TaxID=28930 RepID=A0A2N9ENV8_FAGSY